MSINELILHLEKYNFALAVGLLAIPMVAFLYSTLIARKKGYASPHKYVYATLIYLACGPGMFSAVLTLYTVFIIRSSLLEANLFVYILPILVMATTLAIIRKSVDLTYIPGFNKIQGLITLLAVTFILTLLVMKTRIFLFFGAPMITLVLFVIFLFLLLKWSMNRIFGSKT